MASDEPRVPGSSPCIAGPGEGIDMDLYPPPRDVTTYAQKPLPPLPLGRRSLTSSFSSEVSHALKTSKTALDGSPLLFGWEREGPGVSVALHQHLDSNEFTQLGPRQRKPSTSAVGMGPGIEVQPLVLDQEAGPAPAPSEWKMEQTPSGLDQRPQAAHLRIFPKVKTKDLVPMVPPNKILSPQPRSSVRKILKLTGNMSPATSRSTDVPTLHNSSHKIQQLTGLDFGTRRLGEKQLRLEEEEMPALSLKISSDGYSKDFSEDESYESTESSYSHSYVESINIVNTPLAAPRFAYPEPDPYSKDRTRKSSMLAALRLSDFEAAGAGVSIPEELTPRAKKRYEPWSEQDSVDDESQSSSSSDQSELDSEPTTGELYHDTAISIAKSGLNFAFSRESSPAPVARNAAWGNNRRDDLSPIPVSHSSTGSTPEPGGQPTSSTTTRPFSLKSFRKKASGLSERRGRVSSPLEAITSTPSSTWTAPQRTPYPLVSSSIMVAVEEAEDNQTRFSLLARLFTGGGSNGGNGNSNGNGNGGGRGTPNSSMGKRDSAASGGSRRRSLSTSSQRSPAEQQAVTSAWSPDTPPGSGLSTPPDESGSTGILARTLDHARHAAGLRTKADKIERKRESLREKIKVLKLPDESRSSKADD